MQEKKGISVVIPNYNGAYLLPQILPPLYLALQNSYLPFEVIISDDFSTDVSITIIKNHYPSIILLQNETNCGFSKSINKGIFIAKFDYLLLLNSDVKLTPNYFETLIPYFDLPNTFGVMGRIIGWDNDEIQDGGKYPSFHGTKIKTSGNYIPLESKPSDRLFSMYLSGANALVSREKILALNGFDEIFSPFYVEDFELSLRAWRLGWKCYYDHNAICKHQTSTTIKSSRTKAFVKKIYNRNKFILHAIHLPKNKLWLWYIQLFGETILQTILGRFWFAAAVKLFLTEGKKITIARKKMNTHGDLTSVDVVVAEILASLKGKEIMKF